jgi:hypothetical protein
MRRWIAAFFVCSLACSSPGSDGEHGRPGDPRAESRRSIQPEQPAVQPAGRAGDPGAGFDIRLVRVQPGVHLRTVQPCDVVFSGRAEAIDGPDAARYPVPAVQRMAIKCTAPTGEGWADLVFTRQTASRAGQVQRGRRIQVRLLSADGGYFDYPVVQLESVEGENPELLRVSARHEPAAVPNGFDLAQLSRQPALIGTAQECAVAFADEIVMVQPADRRRSYPSGAQNRMTVRCKHAGGDEPADLVFMPGQALAALSVRRGEVVPVRVVSRNGGFVDYPVLQFAGP